jgi:hypothetical protein
LGEQTELAMVEMSAEDMAILAQDPEYLSLPNDDNLNFGYFEQTVQDDNKGDEPVESVSHQVPEKGKVKQVSEFHIILFAY